MKKINRLLIFVLTGFLFSTSLNAQNGSPTFADLILRNGAIYTVDGARTWAEAVAIKDGRFIYVGSTNGAKKFQGRQTRVLDLQGKFVLPGFHDSHVHPISGGVELGECNLNEATTEDQVLETIRKFVDAHPQAKWIRGGGWQLFIFKDANPHKSLLDKIANDRPIYLTAADGHSAWVNSKALEIAGITKETPNPTNGRIERDPETGEPTGTLREDASGLVGKFLPQYSRADRLEGLRRALKMAAGFGITSLQDASVDEDELEIYQELDRRGELTARVVAALYADPDDGLQQIARFKSLRRQYQGKNLRATAVKIFADGVIEPHTAALLEPYLGMNGERGKPNWQPDALNKMVAALDREGFQIHVHAIGDRAVRMALDAYEYARKINGSRDSRHHIAHLELIHPQDIPRFRELNVIANFQPLWAYADPYITQLTEPFLGAERSRWLYPIGSAMRSGAVVAMGSDWSVTSMNPLDAMQVAVTRRGLTAGEGDAWHAEELIDLPATLAGYTINGAYVNFEEKETGSIAVGKNADLIVLDKNLFAIPKTEIHQVKVIRTFLGGKEIYRQESLNRKSNKKMEIKPMR
ncbi:MAG: amidohydrolase [Acidobacteriota bacterium]